MSKFREENPSFEYSYEGSLFQEAYGVSAYCTYIGGDEQIVHLETQAPNERTLFIIKDSYANCMIPFMLGDYHTITVIDPRYYGDVVSAYANENGIEEVLFVYNMNMLGTDLGIRRVQ